MEILQPNTSQIEWIAVGKNISRTRESSAWDLGDWINFGVATYGKVAAYDQAEKVIISRTRRTLYLYSHVARRFEPKRRVPELSFIHHSLVAKYKPHIVDELLREAIANQWTCKQLHAAAKERCGSREPNDGRRQKVVVSLAEESIAQLKQLANGKKLNWFLTGVIQDFLRSKEFETPECLTTAERRERWEAEGKCISCGSKGADEGHRNCAGCREKVDTWRRWNDTERKALPPEAPEPEAPRLTYAERREAALATGAAPIPPKLHRHSTKPKKEAVKVQWTAECRPKSFIEDREGKVTPYKDTMLPTRFWSEEDAVKANELFKESHGYLEDVVFCSACSAWHLRHRYSNFVPRAVPVESAATLT